MSFRKEGLTFVEIVLRGVRSLVVDCQCLIVEVQHFLQPLSPLVFSNSVGQRDLCSQVRYIAVKTNAIVTKEQQTAVHLVLSESDLVKF